MRKLPLFLFVVLVAVPLAYTHSSLQTPLLASIYSGTLVKEKKDEGEWKKQLCRNVTLSRRHKKQKLQLGLSCLIAGVGSLTSVVHPQAALCFAITAVLGYFVNDVQTSPGNDFALVKKVIQEKLRGRPASFWMSSFINQIAKDSKLPFKVKAYYIPSTELVAAFSFGDPYVDDTFSTNKRCAVLCFTQGLLNTLSVNELRAVIAHECGHLVRDDWVTQTTHIPAHGCWVGPTIIAQLQKLRALFTLVQAWASMDQAKKRIRVLDRCNMPTSTDVTYAELTIDAEDKVASVLNQTRTADIVSVAGIVSELIGKQKENNLTFLSNPF